MADYIPDIPDLLPQGPPFILVDRWLGADGPVTRTAFVVRRENPLVANGCLTVAGLIENIAQTAAAGAGYRARREGRPPRGGAIVAIHRLRIHSLPAAGEELLTETTVAGEVGDIIVISGRITSSDAIVAEVDLKILAANE